MALIKILQYPDPRLRKAGQWVETVDDTVRNVVKDMFETHYHAKNCAALAATQLDFTNPLRITVIDLSEQKNEPLCLINPEIFYREGEQIVPEGCMSVGGEVNERIYEYVKRAMKIKVRAVNLEGQSFELAAEGYLAQCIQHEVDHLEGRLYIERLSALKRERLVKKLLKNLKA